MNVTRRTLLEMALAVPILSAAGCCRTKYPKPLGGSLADLGAVRSFLGPSGKGAKVTLSTPVVDVHAHFFNASDVPVRGFLEECLGHRAHPVAGEFVKALAKIADRLAELAPTADEELSDLRGIVQRTSSLPEAAARQQVAPLLVTEREEAARRAAEAIRGSQFERLYRRYKPRPQGRVAGGAAPTISSGEIQAVVEESEQPSSPEGRTAARSVTAQPDADIADGMLGFLKYMLSARWANLHAYKAAFTEHENSFGVSQVLGSLVDFDYWLDCPPRSAQDDQVLVHKLLQDLHAPYFRAVVAYNPWSDINQGGAALDRVVKAFTEYKFAAVKIYPPTGFRPSGNAANPGGTRKSRPDLKQLDRTLSAFFAKCADLRIPVIAHTARSNGRDNEHDEFGGPSGWEAILARHASDTKASVVDFGHFGGGSGNTWTQEFAALMGRDANAALYGDLGYWDELVCPSIADAPCTTARQRLQNAMSVPIGTTAERVVDRTMFATDWLMLSQMKRWPDYPAKVHESLRTIASDGDIAKVFGGNAAKCFNL